MAKNDNTYVFNEHGVCTNPERAEYRDNSVDICLYAAKTPEGKWCYGYSTHVYGDGYRGAAHPCSTKLRSPFSETKYEAMKMAAERVLKELGEDITIPAKSWLANYIFQQKTIFDLIND